MEVALLYGVAYIGPVVRGRHGRSPDLGPGIRHQGHNGPCGRRRTDTDLRAGRRSACRDSVRRHNSHHERDADRARLRDDHHPGHQLSGLLTDWTVTYSILVALSIADWDGSAYQTPIVLALIPVVISAPDITTQNFTPIGTADIVVASDLSIGQVERHPTEQSLLRLRKTSGSTADFSVYFDNEGTPLYPDAELFLVIRNASNTPITISFTIGSTGGGFNNWTIDNTGQTSLVTGLETGDRFVMAIAEPAIAPSFCRQHGRSPNLDPGPGDHSRSRSMQRSATQRRPTRYRELSRLGWRSIPLPASSAGRRPRWVVAPSGSALPTGSASQTGPWTTRRRRR